MPPGRPRPLSIRSVNEHQPFTTPPGDQVASVNPLNQRSTTVYDPAGRSVAEIDPLNNRKTTTYDAAGRSVATTDPFGPAHHHRLRRRWTDCRHH